MRLHPSSTLGHHHCYHSFAVTSSFASSSLHELWTRSAANNPLSPARRSSGGLSRSAFFESERLTDRGSKFKLARLSQSLASNILTRTMGRSPTLPPQVAGAVPKRTDGTLSIYFTDASFQLHPHESPPVTENKNPRYQPSAPRLVNFADRLQTVTDRRLPLTNVAFHVTRVSPV